MGTGRYSDKLPYKDWFNFGLAQRIHQNFLEQLPIYLIFSLVAGIRFPIASAALNIAFFVVLLSLLVQGSTLTTAARRLGVALRQTTPNVSRIEIDRAFFVLHTLRGTPEPLLSTLPAGILGPISYAVWAARTRRASV